MRERSKIKTALFCLLFAAGIFLLPVTGFCASAAVQPESSTSAKVETFAEKDMPSVMTQSDGALFQVAYYGATSKNGKKAVIPDKITILGTVYQVTSIADEAFKDNKKLREVVIGKNVNAIGSEAFRGCTGLRKITVKSTKLKDINIGEDAFVNVGAGKGSKLVIKVPASKKKAYRKMFRAHGLSKRVIIR